MKFSIVQPGKRWYCPWCGTRKQLVIEKRVAYCPKCDVHFTVAKEQPPDPNSNSGRDHCGSKRRHETIESAFQHASELKELPHKAHTNLTIYRCLFCNFYHVGHRGKMRRLGVLTKEFYKFLDLAAQGTNVAGDAQGEGRK